ncbi:MAG TPA: Asp-tRNA(Asn)/Glu-tRNA(Gln) amidotransferase subunit GatA [Candidatus Saccharimonadia bacterium]|nr:Asp-tRNA(Asn)/Glu-tRNA(Gln) amidotransferase subunit GatA [Candidatus Saccharimonadia bacterium]
MVDLKRPIPDLVADIKAGNLTAVQLVEASLARIEETKDYNAVLEVNPSAREQAKAVDEQIKSGVDLPLGGIPFIAKDNYLTIGTHTTAASHILEPFEAPYEGQVIQRLRSAGAVLVAKANLDAFAHGSSTENSDFGPAKNPVDKTRVPGGSSGGSAAAVALGQACFATGSDTGSSIRLPASFCGVVGMMPSYGLVSRNGVVAMGSSFDTMGALTNSVGDMSLILDLVAGPDPADSTTVEREPTYRLTHTPSNLKGLKIGLIKEYMTDETEALVKETIGRSAKTLADAGATIEEVSIPFLDLALAAYYVLVPAEVSSNLARYDGIRYGHTSNRAKTLEETYRFSREEGFGAEAKRRIMIGTYVLSSGYYDAYYKRAQKVRTLLIEEFKKAFAKYDLLIGPVAPAPAFKLGEKSKDPVKMYLADICTVAVNLVGSCGISVPAGQAGGLPVGLQIIGPQRGERKLLETAVVAERLLADWRKR